MKKVLFAAVAVFLLVLLGGAAFAYYYADKNFGLTESASVTYEEMLDEDTRFVALVQPDMAIPFLEPMLPVQSSKLPSWLPWGPIEMLRRGVPREVAMLAGSSCGTGRIPFTVFVNERLGGPFIAQQTGALPFFLKPGAVLWNDPPVSLPRRGQLEARGSIPLSPAVQSQVSGMFTTPKQGVMTERLTRDHLFEAVLDNREGDFLAFVGALTELGGERLADPDAPTMEELLADPNVAPMLTNMKSGRLAADITGPDEVTILLKITMVEGTPLQVRLPMLFAINEAVFPQVQAALATQGLTLNRKYGQKADFKDGVLVGTFTLNGFRERIQQAINENLS